MPARRPEKPRDPARRTRILEAAKRHFAERGFKGVNLDAVAAEAGCAKGALYLEFADKEALLREVIEQSFAAIRARFAAEVMGIDSPLERLVATLRFAYRQQAAEPLFGKLLREDPDLRALRLQDDAASAAAAKAQVAQIIGWVDEGIARGEIRPDVDRDAIPFVLGVLRFAPQHLGLVTSSGLFAGERTLDAIADIFRAGLAARAATPTKATPTKATPTKKRATTSRARRQQ
ncbi:TetR family transcriptional regulator [Sorangium cellulosum]|uniref:TetR family transcriptional regulator n=1 Tax=Sorangium cellulosum TaxID=56 RepID=A0A2L0EIM7_SORCE|nr:TetR/AcrR family transcriptional regulator [Sorangium cellulosum]AUX39150.1 TetR family transcriptional regulator [Sorangium cellulosum]